jgi:hypothetical protein
VVDGIELKKDVAGEIVLESGLAACSLDYGSLKAEL